MKRSVLLALSAAFLALAKPMAHQRLHKRGGGEVTTMTVYEEATVTVDVTTTICVPQAPNQAQANLGDHQPVAQPKQNDAHPTPDAKPKKAPADNAAKPVPPPAQPPSAPAPKHEQPPVQPPAAAPKKTEDTHPKPQPQPQPQPQPPVQQQQPTQNQPKKEAPKDEKPKDEKPTQGGKNSGGATGGKCGDIGAKCMASDVTIYDDQGAGACGWTMDTNSEDYFALAAGQWDGFTNDMPANHKNRWCGRTAKISVGGKTFDAKVTDKCPGCPGWSIDLSKSLWNKIYNEAPTRKHNVEWWFTGPEIYHGSGA